MEVRKGYKQTELGTIPNDWEIKRFEDVTEAITCGIAATPKYVSRAIGKPFLSASNVQNGRVETDELKYISIDLYNQITKNNKPEKGDVLYTRVGAGIGEAGVIEVTFDFAIYVSLTLIKPKKILNSYFLKSLLNSTYYQLLAKRDQFAGGGVQNLNVAVVKSFPIPLPTPQEQTVIATALSDADALITSLEKLIAKKRNIKQGAMQELLKPKKGWEVKRFGDVIDKIIGGGTPSRSNSEYWGNEIPWVTVKDFATFNPYFAQEYITKKGLDNSASHLIPAGTLITPTRMGLGKAVVYEIDVSINQDLKAIFPSKNLNNRFLFYWFQKNADLIEKLGSGSTVMGISLNELKGIKFCLPTITEQIQIATIFSDMDSELSKLESKLAKYLQIKSGMMQNLLTGKIRMV